MSTVPSHFSVATTLTRREKSVFEVSSAGRIGYDFGNDEFAPFDEAHLGSQVRAELDGLPELSELDAVRHFTRLSQTNYGIETGLYPLGCCTMKYNPKVNEAVARMPGFANLHPFTPDALSQGALEVLYAMQQYLAELAGFHTACIQPAAGAHGELTALMMIRKALIKRGETHRDTIITTDSAHGTNPASCVLNGFKVKEVKTSPDGYLHADDLKPLINDNFAGFMTTNPNTLGIFEREIGAIARLVHDAGGYMYCDGANMNALMGVARPGDMGFDIMQYNVHKTLSTPHGGGGPGSGALGVSERLAPFMPVPVVTKDATGYRLDYDRPDSIGAVLAFHGHFGVLLRAYTYMRELGPDGLRDSTMHAVLNANYLRKKLEGAYHLKYTTDMLHEVIFDDVAQKKFDISNVDIAKRIIDYGFHPPTMSFPLIVHGALMMEPTESASKQELDEYVEALLQIAREAEESPQLLREAPHNAYLRRVDEVGAARQLCMCWTPEAEDDV